jgi:hypothetical protein
MAKEQVFPVKNGLLFLLIPPRPQGSNIISLIYHPLERDSGKFLF